ncbi:MULTISPECIES: flagellar protein FlaG [unclassified Oleiphilus]|uniref:flagellar protein FlaG n=1 Tax=unclassified Oleiphilus TaxID=2631174 RepID=UPI0007C39C3D|nr:MULTISPECIES: flagellar protein FlaG [unclassified Oleiphilus]KZY45412.1 hypothetical protein A3732_10420 [Oleiphilus sp. HI0050]KZZ31572.1 hypothetical protein A3756_06850 [Oleiphilus sp. HI0086]KZZ31654.1 hypothetical protein A3757_05475 [Oleiphilus sp. HI0117]KZZ53400.1 hypothetical protein A3761_00185 [Oleiphilus sp. HI0123]
MSDMKMSGVGQPVKLAAASSAQKAQRSSSVDFKDGASAKPVAQGVEEKPSLKPAEQAQEKVEQAVTKLNDYVQSVQRNLQFNLDDQSGKTIITVVDKQTSEVVRQIPDDVALKLAQDLHQDEPLSLFKAKV